MAETVKLIGSLFVQPMIMDERAPRLSKATTYEIEHPYRTSTSRIFRLWKWRGIAVGRWRSLVNPHDEDAVQAHLLRALTSADGTDNWKTAKHEDWVIQESRRQLGEREDLYDPAHGFLTGVNDGPTEDLGQVAEKTGTFRLEELTEEQLQELVRNHPYRDFL